ncbi:hypothetical protein PCASD_20220 [Puccinia coronata f. sp. avenae]|uniref:Uncharacterized protein n=1 Tax=Puccinia coronata f. sp. avenae TaxID=200324 RepID=A0A2N5TVZ0_9BASI|nr:hypothetical protein PCASD_20220 [Puccinia coronata f. sp. avenae]
MPSHLRNGKDLSFEQLHAAKRAAERKAERAQQQLRLVEIAGCQGASEQPSATKQYGPNELPSSVNQPSSYEPTSTAELTSATSDKLQRVADRSSAIRDSILNKLSDPASHRSAAGGYPPVGYSLSPAALERLRRAQEQQRDAQKLQQYGPVQHGADLPTIPGNSPLGSLLPGNCSSAGLQKVNASPPSSGETAVCNNRKSPRSIDGQAYDADTDTPLSPHELSSQRSGAVYQPLASQSNCCPVNSRAAKGDTNEYSPGDSSARLPGSYASPRYSCPSGNGIVTPVKVAANADCSFANAAAASTKADSTRYWTPARHTATGQAEASTSPALLQAGGLPQARAKLHSAANFTPYQPSPLRRAVPKKWEPAQPHLPEELETPNEPYRARTEEAAATRKPEKHSSFNLSPTSLSN